MSAAARAMPTGPACIVCGCTETRACVDGFGDPCAWIIRTKGLEVCSACHARLTNASPRMFAALVALIAEDELLVEGAGVNERESHRRWKAARDAIAAVRRQP